MIPVARSNLESPSIKIAIALALLRSKKINQQSNSKIDHDDHLWKLKAKERKREILRLREELKRIEDGGQCEADMPSVASCRCYFFDGIGVVGGNVDRGEHWIDEVLRRRFLRLVRWKERRKRVERPLQQKQFLVFNNEDQLSTSTDFLMGLIDGAIVKGMNSSFSTFCHQAVDFISASIKDLLSLQKELELVEEIVGGLVLRLTRRMCNISENDVSGPVDTDSDVQFCIQHLIRKLGKDSFVGQRTLLLLSQKISAVSERLLFMDPFDDSFPCFHGSMFMMIQLVEFLISDNLRIWIADEDLESRLLEEWIRSVLQARKASELLEFRNGLYVLYIERVIGELAKLVGPLARQGKLDPDITSEIFG